jgi:hypothetical protein
VLVVDIAIDQIEPGERRRQDGASAILNYNFTAYKRRARANDHVAEAIARVCRERFGEDPTYLSRRRRGLTIVTRNGSKNKI